MKITKVQIHKYKSYETPQQFAVDPSVTVLVGKNEAGKTAILEAIAKTNYFTDDKNFKFDPVHDYPRKEKKKYDKAGVVEEVIRITYAISPGLRKRIDDEVGKGVFTDTEITIATNYDNKRTIIGLTANDKKLLEDRGKAAGLKANDLARLASATNVAAIDALKATVTQEHATAVAQQKTAAEPNASTSVPPPALLAICDEVRPYFASNLDWKNKIEAYIWQTYLAPALPKFLYYSEYYMLPSRINIEELQSSGLEEEHLKTSKALFELADLNIAEITSSGDFERFVSELEATGNEVTQQLQKYWTTNPDLRIRFQIDKRQVSGSQRHTLDIRVENLKHMVTLPLRNRSKGFNWFFSFIVWFSKIQEDTKSNFVILLDEPGLNLHASAQEDLLRFVDDLAKKYQVIYTTHSPFMVESEHLNRVRTIYEAASETQISDAIQQRDSDTLFPLQAALGYDIAQNLFISKYNLLVEGPADLIFLTMMSSLLESANRSHLRDDVTIVPVGGLDKVATFISLLRASKLNIVCLLDTFTDASGKQRVEDLIREKIIKEKNVRFFDEFATVGTKADLEDMFEKIEYLSFFNGAFPEHKDIAESDLTDAATPIIAQINTVLKRTRYNHYRPAAHAAGLALGSDKFAAATLDRFEKMFKEINSRF